MMYVGFIFGENGYREWCGDKATVNSIMRHYTKDLYWWQIGATDMFPIDENGNVIDDNPYFSEAHKYGWEQAKAWR